jgi:hypothetical protein
VVNVVNVLPIASPIVPPGGTIVVKPRVGVSGNVVLANATLNVRRGTALVAYNQPAVRLAAGTYSVRTTARYRTYTVTTSSTTTTQNVLVAGPGDVVQGGEVDCVAKSVELRPYVLDDFSAVITGSCSSPLFDGAAPVTIVAHTQDGGATWIENNRQIFTSASPDNNGQALLGRTWRQYYYVAGDQAPLYKLKQVTVTTPTRHYSALQTQTIVQTLVVRTGTVPPPPPACATYADFQRVGGDMTQAQVASILRTSGTQWGSVELRADGLHHTKKYRSCDYSGIYVNFIDDAVHSKEYY